MHRAALVVAFLVVVAAVAIMLRRRRLSLPTMAGRRRENLRYLLRCASQALRRDGNLLWWVDFGSLLGLVREGDVILGDNDADVCVRIATPVDRERLVAALRWCVQRFPGLRLSLEPWADAHAFRMWCGDDQLDIYHNHPTPDGAWYIGATGRNSDVATEDIGTPREVWWPCVDAVVCIPEHPVTVLEWRYGDDWRVPRAGFKGRDPA